MTDAVLVVLVLLSALIPPWFLSAMAHPHPGEPRFIYRLRRHPSAIPEYLALLAYGLCHPRFLRTGAAREERLRTLAGDGLVARPRLQETRAATIDVPPEHLWPWIVQMGAGRGGWYWWTPCEAFPEYARWVTDTRAVLPQFQVLRVGESLSDGGPYSTEDRGNWVVKQVEPNRCLVLHAARQVTGGSDFDPRRERPKGFWFVCGWAFVLQALGEGRTRLLVRIRAIGGPAWLFLGMRLVLGKGDRVAHGTMLRRIKSRAEAWYRRS